MCMLRFSLTTDRFRYDTGFIALGLGFAFTVGDSSERPSEMTARECRQIHDIEKMQKIVPFVMRETTFG